MADSFRYLKVQNGYQRSTVFSGFTESGYWSVLPISPASLSIERGVAEGITINFERTNFEEDIKLELLNVPQGVFYSFSPEIITGTNTSTILTFLSDNTAITDVPTRLVVAGVPAPRQVQAVSLVIEEAAYWQFVEVD